MEAASDRLVVVVESLILAKKLIFILELVKRDY